MASVPLRWWVAGGHALELFAGRSWRGHDDIDIGITRATASDLYAWLDGWDLHVAAAGMLTPWDGRPLVRSDHENNVWCRRTPTDPWIMDVLIGDGDDEAWRSRRDPTITRPWSVAVLHSAVGVPFLAPDLQLLMKSKDVRPKDTHDAEVVIPHLDTGARTFLARHLPAHHEWSELLS